MTVHDYVEEFRDAIDSGLKLRMSSRLVYRALPVEFRDAIDSGLKPARVGVVSITASTDEFRDAIDSGLKHRFANYARAIRVRG